MTMAWAVIQEGGSSIELYLSVWDTQEEAEGFRQDCSASGAYRTGEPVELPDSTNWDAVELLLQSVATIDLAEYDEDDYDEDGEFIGQDDTEVNVAVATGDPVPTAPRVVAGDDGRLSPEDEQGEPYASDLPVEGGYR